MGNEASFTELMGGLGTNPLLLSVLNEVRKTGPLQKSMVGMDLPVSKPTRYSMMQELIDRRILVDYTPDNGRNRTRASGIRVVSGRFYTLGVDIHMEGVDVLLLDIAGSVAGRLFQANEVDREKMITRDDRHVILKRIRHGIEKVLDDCGVRPEQIISTGISDSGILSSRDRISIENRHIPDWKEVPIGSIISRIVPAPTYLVQDSSLIALVEMRALGLRHLANALFVTLRQGIGLGLFIHGQLYTGVTGNSGEWSVMNIYQGVGGEAEGKQNLDTLLGMEPISKLLVCGDDNPVDSGDERHDDYVAKSVFNAYEVGDPGTVAGLDQYIELLGTHTANLIYLFDMDHIVMAGRYAHCGEAFLARLKGQVKTHLRGYQDIHVLKGSTGATAATLGAALMAQESVFNTGEQVFS